MDLEDAVGVHGSEHCVHWQDGDGDCCCCGEPNWCPDDGETPEALGVFKARRWACRPGWSSGGGS